MGRDTNQNVEDNGGQGGREQNIQKKKKKKKTYITYPEQWAQHTAILALLPLVVIAPHRPCHFHCPEEYPLPLPNLCSEAHRQHSAHCSPKTSSLPHHLPRDSSRYLANPVPQRAQPLPGALQNNRLLNAETWPCGFPAGAMRNSQDRFRRA
ncbi:60S ribosomal protein [Histoplasma ohiense]